MTKEDFEWVCNFLENEGFSEISDDLISHMKAIETIIDCALEFDYGRPELFGAFDIYREGEK